MQLRLSSEAAQAMHVPIRASYFMKVVATF